MKPIMSLEDFEKQELRQEYIEENIFEIDRLCRKYE